MSALIRIVAFACAVVAFAATDAAAQIINISTGMNAAHSAMLPNFTVDPNFTITGPGGSTYLPQARTELSVSSTYVNDSAMPGSRWLYGVSSAAETGAFFVPGGNYFFRTNVDLTGFSPANAFLQDIKVSSDNAFLQIRVNSTVVFSRPLPTPSPFIEEFRNVLTLPSQLGLGAFGPGINTLEFQVFNGAFATGDGPSPLAFRMLGAVSVPEPSSLLFAACAATLWMRRRATRLINR